MQRRYVAAAAKKILEGMEKRNSEALQNTFKMARDIENPNRSFEGFTRYVMLRGRIPERTFLTVEYEETLGLPLREVLVLLFDEAYNW